MEDVMTTRDKRILNWKTWLAAVVASICIVVGWGTATAPSAEAWAIGRAGIYNMGNVGIGVVYNWSYPNRYDAVLPVGRSTSGMYGWAYAVGFYTGPGWCTNYYVSGEGGNDSTGLLYYYRWSVRGPTFASKPWADDGAVYSYRC
jgi:hypothetical protein